MKNSAAIAHLVLRIYIGIFMLSHGVGKVGMLFSGNGDRFLSVMGLPPTFSLFLATLGEVLFPILVVVGFKIRYTAIPTIITMLVAAFTVHLSDPFFGKQGKEFALLYAFAFLVLALWGNERYTIDTYLSKRK